MSDSIQRGKCAASNLIDYIMTANDTEGWDGDDFQRAIDRELFDDGKYYEDEGKQEICDIMAFLLDAYGTDAELELRVDLALYGIAYTLGHAVGDANVLGESCYLFN